MAWSAVRVLFGRLSVVNFPFARRSVVLWSVPSGGRCFAFLPVSGRFLFSRMFDGRCLNQYMVGDLWSVVCGRCLVGGLCSEYHQR